MAPSQCFRIAHLAHFSRLHLHEKTHIGALNSPGVITLFLNFSCFVGGKAVLSHDVRPAELSFVILPLQRFLRSDSYCTNEGAWRSVALGCAFRGGLRVFVVGSMRRSLSRWLKRRRLFHARATNTR